MPPRPVDLNSLTLEISLPEPEYNSDGEEYSDDEDSEWPWFQRVIYHIKTPSADVGWLKVWIIDVLEIRSSFYGEMDQPSQECMEFGFTLFDKRGQLRTKFAREGTGVWGPEVNGSSLLYVENIEVKPRYRGRGIAKKALEMVWQIPEVSIERPKFMFAWPTIIPDRSEPLSPTEFDAQRERLANLFRFVGYRRVGETDFFCLAKDRNHPSRRIPQESDAAFRRDDPGASSDRDGAFLNMMGQWGVPGYPR